MARFPFETLLTREATDDGDLPIEPTWLGLWLGDGLHSDTIITSSDFDETRGYLAGYVDRLNATRPAGAAPLHLRISPKLIPQDHPVHSNVTVFDFAISSTYRDDPGFCWNLIRTGLQKLGIFNNHKERGIPQVYMSAGQDATAALLAGLIDTDGSLVTSTSYEFCQSIAHHQLLDDTRRLAEGLGIKVGRVGRHWTRNPANQQELRESMRFCLYGPELALIQPYLMMPRKRVRGVYYDNHLRGTAVHPLGATEAPHGPQDHLRGD